MTQFEQDMNTANEFVEVLRFFMGDDIYKNPHYRLDAEREGCLFIIKYQHQRVISLYKTRNFGVTMTTDNVLQVNADDDCGQLLEFIPFGSEDTCPIPSVHSEEQYFQDSLIMEPDLQMELLLISKIRDYIKTTDFKAIEIVRTHLPMMISDMNKLQGLLHDTI